MNKIKCAGDAAGIVVSALCLLHCLAAPMLLAAAPMLRWTGDDGVHLVLVGVALLAALATLGPGYLAHRRARIPLLGGVGLACLAAAVFVAGPYYGRAAETWLSVAGALLLGAAHLGNRACTQHAHAALRRTGRCTRDASQGASRRR